MNFRKSTFLIPVFLLLLVNLSLGAQVTSLAKPRLIFFHSLNCHNCIKVRETFMPNFEKIFKDRIEIDYRDINDIENYKLLLSLKDKYGKNTPSSLPIVFFEGNILSGQEQITRELINLVDKRLSGQRRASEKILATAVDLVARFKDFKPWAVISAGLIDGINPCAFTVIVFFISFLTLQGYRKYELIAIGLVYIFAVFLTYLAIGLGMFGFLYQLRGFWIMAKIINYSIGIFCIVLGVAALYDFLKFKKTGESQGLLLQLPKPIKIKINSIIGSHYRADHREGSINKKLMPSLIISALVTGFLVSLLEAVCTGQVYLPTITFVLKTTPYKLSALGYLLLYNFMFIVPLFFIFILALLGVTSEQFSGFLKKHMLMIKFLMVILFLSLGLFLIWKA